MKKLTILFTFLLFYTANSQELMGEFGNRYYTPSLYKSTYNNPDGSPYLNENFSPASINENNETYLVRFDAYLGNVEVLIEKNKVIILEPNQKYTIRLKDGSNRVYETIEYREESGDVKTSFFELKHQAPTYRLYLKEFKKFYKGEKAQAYQEAKPARFKKTKDVFYIQDLSGDETDLIEIPKKVKDLTVAFPINPKETRAYIKNEKLELNEIEDLIKLFDSYYSK